MVIQYVLILAFLAAFALTWRRSRQSALGRTAAILWSVFWVAASVLVLRPEFATAMAAWLGVGRGVDAVIYVAIFFLYYLVFRIFLRLDKIDRDITVIVRSASLAAGEKDGERKPQ